MASIDKLKSTITSRGGMARKNRYNVFFTPPTMSLFNIDPQAILSNVLTGQDVSVGTLINDPRDISILCDSVTLPGRSLSTMEYQDQFQVIKMPYTFVDSEVNFSFLLTKDYYMKRIFDNWVDGIINAKDAEGKVVPYQLGYKTDYSTDIVIQQLDEEDVPVYGVKLINAFPINIGDIELGNGNENEFSKVDITFGYDKYEVEGPLSSTVSQLTSGLSIFG
jgi:hypothetical protein|tara:strand:+ start:379 stop:1041 length:663 start_codon:yes stop_codon:yes gene_type:complete